MFTNVTDTKFLCFVGREIETRVRIYVLFWWLCPSVSFRKILWIWNQLSIQYFKLKLLRIETFCRGDGGGCVFWKWISLLNVEEAADRARNVEIIALDVILAKWVSDRHLVRLFALEIVKYYPSTNHNSYMKVINQWEARLSWFTWSHVWMLTLGGYGCVRCDDNIDSAHNTSCVTPGLSLVRCHHHRLLIGWCQRPGP